MTKLSDKSIGQRLGNIDLLPEELRQQLVSLKPKQFDDQILSVISSYPKMASVDEIMVGLYRQYGRIEDRSFLANKLYRMTVKGKIISVKHKRGLYMIKTEPKESDNE